MDHLFQDLSDQLNQFGYEISLFPVHHLNDLKEEFKEMRSSDQDIERYLYHYLDKIDYTIPASLPDAKSVLVVAVQQPIARTHFQYGGKSHPVILPPTYLLNASVDKEEDQKLISEVNRHLREALGKNNFKAVKINLPGKLAAVRSGLGAYGKNNICYINEKSSFYWIGTYLTDMPCKNDPWREETVMKQCSDCDLCQSSCPTGAIDEKRFLIHAKNCITFMNESSADFPEWIDVNWHNAIIGCMRCQIICPVNISAIKNIQDFAEFDEEETGLILEKTLLSELPEKTYRKLEDFNFIEDYEILPRNLKVLIDTSTD